MALPVLATMTDLSARSQDVANSAAAGTMLEVASSLVREAAGSPILQTTATFSVWAVERGEYLTIPVRPMRSVSTVTLDGSAVTDYKLIDGALWRYCGWYWYDPLEVVITGVVGLPKVPSHIVQLVCDLAILGVKSISDGALDPRVAAESIDDYSVTFAKGYESVATAMSIPSATRLALRSRFGGGASSVRFR